jgi:hypothetical protein
MDRVPRTKQRGLSGIYTIWSQDRKLVYVGSSTNLDNRRAAHNPAVMLGGEMTVVREMPGATRRELCQEEDATILDLRAQGCHVVNKTNAEMYLERAAQGFGTMTLEQRQARTRAANRGRSRESYQEAARRGYATRRANGNSLTPHKMENAL